MDNAIPVSYTHLDVYKRQDKTLLDALIPAQETMETSLREGKPFREAVADAAQSAEQGAENTKKITANKGRASYLGERSINSVSYTHLDVYKRQIELYVRYESICPFQNADVAKREQ